jgi:hypothetical protein
MNIGRRELLFAAAAPTPGVATPPVAIVADRGKPDIASVFEELGVGYRLLRSSDEPGAAELLWIVSPTYPEPSGLPAPLLARVERFLAAGKGVYAEFVTNFPGLAASDRMHKSGIARLFVAEPLPVAGTLPAGTILEEHDSMYLPLEAAGGTVLSFGRIAGVREIVPGFRPETAWPGLVAGERGPGRFALATTSLSEFRRRKYAPVAHWERFIRELALWLLPGETRRRALATWIPLRAHTEPRAWAQPGEKVRVVVEGGGESEWNSTTPGAFRIPVRAARGGRIRTGTVALRVAGRKAAYMAALARNVRWFERSGVLLRADGTAGVAEWVSGPDIEGNRNAFGAEQMFSPERADCVFQSGLAFWLYGKLARSPRCQSAGGNMLRRIMDFQRLEAHDPGYGLWYSRGRSGRAFQDDTSWATIGALAGYRYTRENAFRHRGLISAEAQMRAFGPDDSERPPLSVEALRGPRTERADEHPHNGGCVLSAWMYTYGITGERKYLDASLPMLERMIEAFPKIPRYIISRTCESSRFLLPLALASAYTREGRFARALAEQAEYLASRMAPCGAIQEGGSNIAGRVAGGDLGLTYDQNETVSDQLYCTGFAAMNFWIAYKATGEERYRDLFFRVADYLVRIQIENADPMVDGGWMRGFDYGLWEYYGANADMAWTAYSMETGWQNAIIDIALALYLLDDPFFEPR